MFADHNQRKRKESLYIGIGLSAGKPVEDDSDLLGSAMQLAARICARKEPDHIRVAQIVLKLVCTIADLTEAKHTHLDLLGKSCNTLRRQGGASAAVVPSCD